VYPPISDRFRAPPADPTDERPRGQPVVDRWEGSLWTAVTGTAAPTAEVLLGALLVTGAVGTLAATVLFEISERRAKEQGLLDRTTGS
jgi:hypothetical protein